MWWLTFGAVNVVLLSVTAAWLKLQQLRKPSVIKSLPRRLVYSAATPAFDSTKQSEADFAVNHVRQYYQYACIQPGSRGSSKHPSRASVPSTTAISSCLTEACSQQRGAQSAHWPPHLEAKAQVILQHARVAKALAGFLDQPAPPQPVQLANPNMIQHTLPAEQASSDSEGRLVPTDSAQPLYTLSSTLSPQGSLIPSRAGGTISAGEGSFQEPFGPGTQVISLSRQPFSSNGFKKSLPQQLPDVTSAQKISNPNQHLSLDAQRLAVPAKPLSPSLQPLPEPCPADGLGGQQPSFKSHCSPAGPKTFVTACSQTTESAQDPESSPPQKRQQRKPMLRCFSGHSPVMQ